MRMVRVRWRVEGRRGQTGGIKTISEMERRRTKKIWKGKGEVRLVIHGNSFGH